MEGIQIFILIFGSIIIFLMLFVCIGSIISDNVYTETLKDYCKNNQMYYFKGGYCSDGENAIRVIHSTIGFGFKKSDYVFRIIEN